MAVDVTTEPSFSAGKPRVLLTATRSRWHQFLITMSPRMARGSSWFSKTNRLHSATQINIVLNCSGLKN